MFQYREYINSIVNVNFFEKTLFYSLKHFGILRYINILIHSITIDYKIPFDVLKPNTYHALCVFNSIYFNTLPKFKYVTFKEYQHYKFYLTNTFLYTFNLFHNIYLTYVYNTHEYHIYKQIYTQFVPSEFFIILKNLTTFPYHYSFRELCQLDISMIIRFRFSTYNVFFIKLYASHLFFYNV